MSLLDSGRKTPRKHGASVAKSSGDLAEGGVGVREADYSRPQTTGAALAGVDRLLLVSSSEAGQRVAQHTNVIEAARTAETSRIVYTSMLNADDSTNPLAGEHRDSERALRDMGVPFRSTPPPDKRSASSAAPAFDERTGGGRLGEDVLDPHSSHRSTSPPSRNRRCGASSDWTTGATLRPKASMMVLGDKRRNRDPSATPRGARP